MFSIYNIKEKEVKERREKCQKRNSLSKNKRGGSRENKLDIIDSESCLQGMKRK
jgi:hypothetical protein